MWAVLSARDELIEALTEANWRNPFFSPERCEVFVDEMLAQHVREAEEEE